MKGLVKETKTETHKINTDRTGQDRAKAQDIGKPRETRGYAGRHLSQTGEVWKVSWRGRRMWKQPYSCGGGETDEPFTP